jgi:hypothetical protein
MTSVEQTALLGAGLISSMTYVEDIHFAVRNSLNCVNNLSRTRFVDGSRFNIINKMCRIHYIPGSRCNFTNNTSYKIFF